MPVRRVRPAAASRTSAPHSGTAAERTCPPCCVATTKQQLTPCATGFGAAHALNVATGAVTGKIIQRNDSATFIEFLTELDQQIPDHLKIHLVMDNGSSHTSKATRAWLADHPGSR
jgi:hypothetical protein